LVMEGLRGYTYSTMSFEEDRDYESHSCPLALL